MGFFAGTFHSQILANLCQRQNFTRKNYTTKKADLLKYMIQNKYFFGMLIFDISG